ncbi:cysteine--tRNA ligase [Blattabacterium cuenoti]|uniref:cysteine--tRNA ligase n=1 Tax=Blattabacterium cuenoti TaxID=1653831 RepID=UPI00163CCDA5|nr:cysteine--tRNA ligase [Blattabacterium cuenoti]
MINNKINNIISIIKNNIKIYNSLTNRKELFISIHKDYIGIYVCGPTVYNHLHIGNIRTFIFFDVVFRYFKHLGYKVRYVRNITDVGHLERNVNKNKLEEDKILKRSRIEGLEPMEIVQKYTISFHNILRILNVLPPNIEPYATGHIIEQIEVIKKLISKKLAYVTNGSVYFDVKKYMKYYSYGILSKNKLDKLLKKKSPFIKEKKYYSDFCLWKKSNTNHIMNWQSPWSIGYPGWHIECTTMSIKYLGNIFDIHGGGIDLKFPHHECEIAQSTGICNDENNFARYWIHVNMLTINGKKMSKSDTNKLILQDLIEKYNISSNVFRFFVLKFHYRNILNFSIENLINSKKSYNKLYRSIEKLDEFNVSKINNNKSPFDVFDWIYNCYNAINDDFNTPLLISYLFKITHITNSNFIMDKLSEIHLFFLKKYMKYFIFDILGFDKKNINEVDSYKKFEILVRNLISFRNEMRVQKNWIISDRIRDELNYIEIPVNDKKN